MGGHTEPQRHAGATRPPEEPGGACMVTTRVTRVFRHRPAGEAESSCLLAAQPKRLRLPEPASRGGLLAGSTGTGSSHSRAARPRALQLRTRPIHCPVHSWEGGGSAAKRPPASSRSPALANPVVPGTKLTARPLPAPPQAGAGSQGRKVDALAWLAATLIGHSGQGRRGGVVADADPGKEQHQR